MLLCDKKQISPRKIPFLGALKILPNFQASLFAIEIDSKTLVAKKKYILNTL